MPSARHLYVHVPFCARRCSYCDFAIAVRRRVPVDDYLAALGREYAARVHERLVLDTLYLGGGTPSLLGGDGVRRLIDLIDTRAIRAADAELTIEANPDDVTASAARAWREAGVNRVSLGVQSFDPRVLAWMHRSHDVWQVQSAVDRLREAGIERLSVDLIFALPESLGRDWERDLARAIELGTGHLSLYGLTVEPATPLARWVERGATTEAPEERYASEFLAASRALTAAGFHHYEVSNFARDGQLSRHNSAYWTRVPYLGLGPSAHGFDGETREWNVSAYAEWSRRALSGENTTAGQERLDEGNRAAEDAYLGLRTSAGVAAGPSVVLQTEGWRQAGWAEVVGDRLRLTPEGWLRLDALAADLTLAASR